MVSIFQKNGSGNWIVRYFDESGKRLSQSTGTTDRKVADLIAEDIKKKVALRAAGLIDPRDERRLIEDKKPLLTHLSEFGEFLKNKQRSSVHVKRTVDYAQKILGNTTRISAITPGGVQAALYARREDGLGANTANHYLRAAKSFTRWLVRDGRAISDPLVGLSRFNVAVDRRHVRRVLTQDELARLIAAAERGPVVARITGPDRAMLYRLAAGTGFRAAELAALRPEAFSLNSKPPTVTCHAAYSKGKREDIQPIRNDLADLLRSWLPTRQPKARLFPPPAAGRHRTGDIIRKDLEAAGIPFETDEGVVDFHSLRHGFITSVVAAGASVKEAQTLARHTTPDLTFRVYAHARLIDTAKALENMPALPEFQQAAQATGTDGLGWRKRHHSQEQTVQAQTNQQHNDDNIRRSDVIASEVSPTSSDASDRPFCADLSGGGGGSRTHNVVVDDKILSHEQPDRSAASAKSCDEHTAEVASFGTNLSQELDAIASALDLGVGHFDWCPGNDCLPCECGAQPTWVTAHAALRKIRAALKGGGE